MKHVYHQIPYIFIFFHLTDFLRNKKQRNEVDNSTHFDGRSGKPIFMFLFCREQIYIINRKVWFVCPLQRIEVWFRLPKL